MTSSLVCEQPNVLITGEPYLIMNPKVSKMTNLPKIVGIFFINLAVIVSNKKPMNKCYILDLL